MEILVGIQLRKLVGKVPLITDLRELSLLRQHQELLVVRAGLGDGVLTAIIIDYWVTTQKVKAKIEVSWLLGLCC